VLVGFDTAGQRGSQPDSKKVAMILAVIKVGYKDHVLLSSDFYLASELKSNGGVGYSTVLTVFVPELRYTGVKEATIHKILVDNPRRFLAFVPKT
jgi:predicted metal-dependent phosphotriesterase family hydrolase